jgi:hypothetical protein
MPSLLRCYTSVHLPSIATLEHCHATLSFNGLHLFEEFIVFALQPCHSMDSTHLKNSLSLPSRLIHTPWSGKRSHVRAISNISIQRNVFTVYWSSIFSVTLMCHSSMFALTGSRVGETIYRWSESLAGPPQGAALHIHETWRDSRCW